MPNKVRIYYKNQTELSNALKDIVDAYFKNMITEAELEDKIIKIISANKNRFYKNDTKDIAYKPAQILGKARQEVLLNILDKKGELSWKNLLLLIWKAELGKAQ